MQRPIIRFLPATLCRLGSTYFSPCRLHSMSSNEVRQAKLNLLTAEYELLRHQDPENMPTKLTPSQVDYLLTLQNVKRLRPRKSVWLDVSHRLREEALQRIRHLEVFPGEDHLLLPFIGSEIEKLVRRQQTSLMPYLPNIIFDISFDEHMSTLECKNLAEQLMRIFNLNKFGIGSQDDNTNLNLFNLHVTNLQSSKLTSGFLGSLFGPDKRHYYPNVHFHEPPFTEIFPDRRLIYMSPHAKETMTEYDHEAFYIIGGIVDRREIIELTPAKCSQLGIRSVRLPIELFVHQEVQTLCDVYKLLHEFKYNPSALFAQESISKLVKRHIPHKKPRQNA